MRSGTSSADLVDLYIEEVHLAVRAIRSARGGLVADPHKGAPPISRSEFAAHALASLLCSAGGFVHPHDPTPAPPTS